MKVAMVVRDLNFGIGRHVYELVHALKMQGIDVDVKIGKSNLNTNSLTSQLDKSGFFDVIHIQGSPFGGYEAYGTPRVVTVHSLLETEWRFEKKLSYMLGHVYEKNTLRNADKIIAVSDVLWEELINSYRVPTDKVAVIPNGIDVDNFNLSTAKRAYFKFAFSCGRDVKRKNFKTFTKACRNAHIMCILFHGEKSEYDVLDTYKKASVFVMPSLYESFGLTVLEAMASRCPVIASNIPAMRELVVDRCTGLLFDAKDADDLAMKLVMLLGDEQLSCRLADNAYRHIKENFDVAKTAEETIKVYDEVVGK